MVASQIQDILRYWAEKAPDQLALVDSLGSWTYKQLAGAVQETCSWLETAGVRAGDRILLVGENSRSFGALFFALAKTGAWPVLANPRIAGHELDQIRDHSGARLSLFVVWNSAQGSKHAKRHSAISQNLGALGDVMVSSLNSATIPEAAPATCEQGVAALLYTSGTTGLPKGVMLTHANLVFMASRSAAVRSVAPTDRIAGVLPMTHAVGLSVTFLGTLFAGATLLMRPRFDPVDLLESLEKEKLTILMGTPSMFAMICDYARMKGIERLRFPHLRIITASGAPLQMATKAGTEVIFGLPLHNGYGVTECSPTIALARPERPRQDMSVGEVFPEVEIKIVDSDNRPLPDGEIGELKVRGPNVMKGYYRGEADTADVIDSEGWFNTRDLAKRVDANLFLVGRAKDLIVRFGFNVYPAEVEAVLNACPGVARSAVVGRSISGTGDEEIIAFVEMQPENPTEAEDILKHASQRLAPYKQPSRIVMVTEMPLTPTGKVRKEELKKTLEGF